MANIMEKQFYKQRSDFDKSCIERDKKLTMPEGVEYTENIAYTNDGNPSHQLDIYRPKDREGEVLPVIINSGTSKGCSKDQYPDDLYPGWKHETRSEPDDLTGCR